MIRLLTPADERQFLDACAFDGIIGARMATLLRCYGYDFKDCGLWFSEDEDGNPSAAISRFDGWLVISAREAVDLNELSAFAGAIGEFRYVEAAPFVCEALDIKGDYESSHMMRYAGGPFGGDFALICENPPLREIYEIVCAANPWFQNTTSWPGWYTHTSHLFRHGLGFAGLIYENGRPVSTGGVFTMSEEFGVIGCLATLPEFRGRGYASLLTKYLINRILTLGKLPALFCLGDSLADYYATFGFARSGKWGQITLDNAPYPPQT